MTARSIRRVALGAIAATLVALGTAGAPALANTEETPAGSCDSNAPTVAGFACFDSDDVAINLASAQTKASVVHNHLNIDWQLNGSTRGVIINGWGRIKSGQVGKLTLTVQCFKAGQAAAYETKQVSTEATTSFHLGKDTGKLVNATCPASPQLATVKVKLKFVTGAGTVQELSRSAAFGGS